MIYHGLFRQILMRRLHYRTAGVLKLLCLVLVIYNLVIIYAFSNVMLQVIKLQVIVLRVC
jgi:hypothetical protein